MQYLKMRNWDKWQSYRKDRGQPPWIKVHRSLMRDPEWVSLNDAERGQLVSMWMLAADRDGEIPASPELIQKLCFLNKKPNLNKFKDLHFIELGINTDDAKVTTERRQNDQPEERREETEADKNIKDTSLEPSTGSSPEASKIFISIPTNKKDESCPIAKSKVDEWAELFPAVDVEQELRQMVAWSKANPGKRKTSRGMEKFIVNWLGREQDKGKPPAPKQPEPSITEVTPFRTVKTQEEYKQFLTDQEAGRLKTQEIIQQVKDKYRRQAS